MRSLKRARRVSAPPTGAKPAGTIRQQAKELVIVTGISGAGKASAIRSFEDIGFHAVDNLPLELLPDFARLVRKSGEIERAAIVVDIREGTTLDRLPEILKTVKKLLPTRVVFLDAQDAVLVQRYSETRRPHPLGRSDTVSRSIVEERQLLDPIRNVADALIDTSNFNVHELRAHIQARFGKEEKTKQLLVSCLSFGFKNGVPLDADMVFDVRFLPNPHFVPEFRKKTGQNPRVAAYIGCYLGVEAGQLAKLRHKMRIGQEAHIEDHIRIQRNAVLEAKTETRNQQALVLLLLAKASLNLRAQLMHVVI